jgi:hypothetical protein
VGNHIINILQHFSYDFFLMEVFTVTVQLQLHSAVLNCTAYSQTK